MVINDLYTMLYNTFMQASDGEDLFRRLGLLLKDLGYDYDLEQDNLFFRKDASFGYEAVASVLFYLDLDGDALARFDDGVKDLVEADIRALALFFSLLMDESLKHPSLEFIVSSHYLSEDSYSIEEFSLEKIESRRALVLHDLPFDRAVNASQGRIRSHLGRLLPKKPGTYQIVSCMAFMQNADFLRFLFDFDLSVAYLFSHDGMQQFKLILDPETNLELLRQNLLAYGAAEDSLSITSFEDFESVAYSFSDVRDLFNDMESLKKDASSVVLQLFSEGSVLFRVVQRDYDYNNLSYEKAYRLKKFAKDNDYVYERVRNLPVSNKKLVSHLYDQVKQQFEFFFARKLRDENLKEPHSIGIIQEQIAHMDVLGLGILKIELQEYYAYISSFLAKLKTWPQISYAQLEELINAWDPVNLLALGAPDDEYGVEIRALMPYLHPGMELSDLVELLDHVFHQYFNNGRDYVSIYESDLEELEAVAKEILGLYKFFH